MTGFLSNFLSQKISKPILVTEPISAGPFTKAVDEEVESQHLRFIQTPPGNMSFNEAVVRFNSNISYSGLLHAVTAEVGSL